MRAKLLQYETTPLTLQIDEAKWGNTTHLYVGTQPISYTRVYQFDQQQTEEEIKHVLQGVMCLEIPEGSDVVMNVLFQLVENGDEPYLNYWVAKSGSTLFREAIEAWVGNLTISVGYPTQFVVIQTSGESNITTSINPTLRYDAVATAPIDRQKTMHVSAGLTLANGTFISQFNLQGWAWYPFRYIGTDCKSFYMLTGGGRHYYQYTFPVNETTSANPINYESLRSANWWW